jgi:hypothetical protein
MKWHTNLRWVFVVGLGLILAMPQLAAAQRRGRGFGRFLSWSKADLAAIDQVQVELKMTDGQKAKTNEVNEQLRSDRHSILGGSFGQYAENRQKLEDLNRVASAEVDDSLDDAQRKRLQEIAIQVYGSRLLHDQAVGEQLQLSDEQKTRLAVVQAANSKTMEDLYSDAQQLSREDWRSKGRELLEKADEERMTVLTDEQRAQFDAMAGEPFEVDWSQFRGRFGRGGGPRSGNN